MTTTSTPVGTVTVGGAEFGAIKTGVKQFVFAPVGINAGVGDVIEIAEQIASGAGETLLATVTYVISPGNPCALSPEALNPAYTTLSITIHP